MKYQIEDIKEGVDFIHSELDISQSDVESINKEILTYAHENTTPEGLREIEKSMDEALGGGK